MKNFINDSITRCSNTECKHKSICKRFAQAELEKAQNIPSRYIVKFNDVNCEKIIRFL